METRVTYCRICEAACGMLADVDDGRLVRLRPDREHIVSRGFACAKGTRFRELHTSPDRIDHPLIRRGKALERVDWDSAITDVGRTIARIRREHGRHSIAVYLGNPAAFSYTLPLFALGLVKALGTRNHFSAGSLDCNNKFVVARHMLGSPAVHPVPDLDHARFALLIGTNPSVSQSSFVHAPRMIERLRAIEARGGRVVVVDPRRTETARSVGRWLPIVPDTDAALLLALLNVIFEECLERRDVVERCSTGAAQLERAVARFTPKAVSTVTRIAAEEIRELARAFARADGAFCHLSTGVNQGTFGTIAYAAKIALELVTGNLDRQGGALLPRGAIDLAALGRFFRADVEPRSRSRIGDFPTVLGALPTPILADEILTPGDGQVRALIVIAGNPLLSAPNGGRLRKALEKLELLVSIDLFVNDTAALATHVLPCTDFLEREDVPLAQLQLQPVPYLQWTDRVVEPRGERRPEWRILLDLARAAGVPMFGNRTADLATRAAIAVGGPELLVAPLLAAALGARPIQALRRKPHGVLINRERVGDYLARRITTPSRRVELFPSPLWERLSELEATLDAAQNRHVLRLFTKRERLGHNSWMHGNSALEMVEQRAYLSVSDAERLGVKKGQRVRLVSEVAAIELPVEVTNDVVPGAIAITHGYGHDEQSGWSRARARGGANVNLLAASGKEAIDPLTGMCRFVGVPIRVEVIADD